jgi:serine/threonine protein kinase
MAEDVFGIVGSVIAGAYHVEAVVAEGGFGVVYRAHHGGFGAPVALKLLKLPHQNSLQQAAFLELFRAEAALLFRLSASLPTVVRPLHVDTFTAIDGRFVPYLVLEWLEGVTLGALIEERTRTGEPPLSLPELVALLTPVARALERAHHFDGPDGAVSIVHRDLKPENLFVARTAGQEVVKILDFGIGKVKMAASQVAGRMSQDGQATSAFTPAYGAPEQWAPKQFGQTGPWTDVWGLALCLVEALAGGPVIEGDMAAMLSSVLDPARRPTPRSLRIKVSDVVEAVFLRALSLDPRSRQPDAGVFWDELVIALGRTDLERPSPRARGSVQVVQSTARANDFESCARASSAGPQSRRNVAMERVLALDLEFDPAESGQVRAELAPSSTAHWVPELDLAPLSVPASRSGTHRALTEYGGSRSASDPLQGLGLDAAQIHAPLDLDLPADEPVARRVESSRGMKALGPASLRRGASSIHEPVDSLVPMSEGTLRVSGVVPVSSSDPPGRPESGALGHPSQRLVPVSSRKPQTVVVSALSRFDPRDVPELTLTRRLRPSLALIGLSIAFACFDPIYASLTGQVLILVGCRLSVFGGLLLFLALALAARQVFWNP